ncbi:MAG: hypothetical protein ACBR20_03485 [Microcoleus sp.]
MLTISGGVSGSRLELGSAIVLLYICVASLFPFLDLDISLVADIAFMA